MKNRLGDKNPFRDSTNAMSHKRNTSHAEPVVQEMIYRGIEQQSNKIANLVPVRSSFRGSNNSSVSSFKQSRGQSRKSTNSLSSSARVDSLAKLNKRARRDKKAILQKDIEDDANFAYKRSSQPVFGTKLSRPAIKAVDCNNSCLSPHDYGLASSVGNSKNSKTGVCPTDQRSTNKVSQQQSQSYYVDDPDSQTYPEAETEGAMEPTYSQANAAQREVEEFEACGLTHGQTRNSQIQHQVSNMLSEQPPVDLEHQLLNLLDITHVTNHTHLEPQYQQQIETEMFTNQYKSQKASQVCSPIGSQNVGSKKLLPNQNRNYQKSRNQLAVSPVVLRDYRYRGQQRLDEFIASRSRTIGDMSTASLGSQGTHSQIVNNRQLIYVDDETTIQSKQKPVRFKKKIKKIKTDKSISHQVLPKVNRVMKQSKSQLSGEMKETKKKAYRPRRNRQTESAASQVRRVPVPVPVRTRKFSASTLKETQITNLPLAKMLQLNIPVPQEMAVDPSPEDNKVDQHLLDYAIGRAKNGSGASNKTSMFCTHFNRSQSTEGHHRRASSINDDIDFTFEQGRDSKTNLTKVQNERLKKVHDRIRDQQMKLEMMESHHNWQNEQFQKIVESKPETFCQSKESQSRGNVFSPVSISELQEQQLQKKPILNQTFNSIKHKLSIGSGQTTSKGQQKQSKQQTRLQSHHTKNNSLQTAQFLMGNEDAAEYYFSAARSLNGETQYDQKNDTGHTEPQIHSILNYQVDRDEEIPSDFDKYNTLMGANAKASRFANLQPVKHNYQVMRNRKPKANTSVKRSLHNSIESQKNRASTSMSNLRAMQMKTRSRHVSLTWSQSKDNNDLAPLGSLQRAKKAPSKHKRTKSRGKKKEGSLSINRKSIQIDLQGEETTKKQKRNSTVKRRKLTHVDPAKFQSQQTTMTMTQDESKKGQTPIDDTLEMTGSEAREQHLNHQNILLHLSPSHTQGQFQEFNDPHNQLMEYQSDINQFEQQMMQQQCPQPMQFDHTQSRNTAYNTYELPPDDGMQDDLVLETATTDTAYATQNVKQHRKVIKLEAMEKRNRQLIEDALSLKVQVPSALDLTQHFDSKSQKRPVSATNQRFMRSLGPEHGRGHTTTKSGSKKSHFKSSTNKMIDFSQVSQAESKSTLLVNQINHKNKVFELKSQFLTQKNQEKNILTQQIQLEKMAINKVKKETRTIQVQMRRQQEKINEGLKSKAIKQNKHKASLEQLSTVSKQVLRLETDRRQAETATSRLQAEVNSELQIIQDLQLIAQKYKRLLADQRRDKDQLAQTVKGQRKVIQNLVGRKEMLNEDGAKLVDKFQCTLVQDEISGNNRAKTLLMSRQDQEILNC